MVPCRYVPEHYHHPAVMPADSCISPLVGNRIKSCKVSLCFHPVTINVHVLSVMYKLETLLISTLTLNIPVPLEQTRLSFVPDQFRK